VRRALGALLAARRVAPARNINTSTSCGPRAPPSTTRSRMRASPNNSLARRRRFVPVRTAVRRHVSGSTHHQLRRLRRL